MIAFAGQGTVEDSGAPSGLEIGFMAGAEHEFAAETEKWTTAPSVLLASGIADAHGRVYDTNAGIPKKTFTASENTVSARLRMRPRSTTTLDAIIFFASDGVEQCRIRFLSDGSFVVSRVGTALATSATGLWTIDNWFEAEFKAFVDDSGSYEAHFWDDSGTLLATLSGSGDTKNASIAGVATYQFGSTASNGTYVDNVSIDLAGNLLGRCRVETLYPNAAGDLAQFTRGGTDTGANYSQVNEAVRDGVSYVTSTAIDQYDFYNIEPRSITGTPKAVQVNFIGQRVAGGTDPALLKLALRIGGVTYDGAITHSTSGTTIRGFQEVWSNNPATGNAWTDADINSLQIGVKSATDIVRVHQLCAEVLVGL